MKASWIKGWEKIMHQKSAYRKERPPWLKVQYANNFEYKKIDETLKANDINTVCESANCPNIFKILSI